MRRITSAIVAASLAICSFATPASAGEWGCKIRLCEANSIGWEAIPDCWPPMTAWLSCRMGFIFTFPCPKPPCPEEFGQNNAPVKTLFQREYAAAWRGFATTYGLVFG